MFDQADLVISYTNEQAIEDGIKFALGENLFITTNAANTLAPEWENDIRELRRVVVGQILKYYNAGVYAYPVTADPHNEADKYFAYYIVNGEKVWAILDGDGLTILLPEDY